MKIEKVQAGMKAVEVVHKCLRDFGAVCKNCERIAEKNEDRGVCKKDQREVRYDDFCQDFRFINDESASLLFEKIMNYVAGENGKVS